MPRRSALFLLLLALWLPLQSALAFAMPFCGHGKGAAVAGAQFAHEHGGHHHVAPAAKARPATREPLANCDQCGLCHLACAGFLASSPQRALADRPRHVLVGAEPPAVTNPDPDRLDRPPLSAA